MTLTPTGKPLRVGSRYRLTRDAFDMYASTENCSASREIYEGEEFVVLHVCEATIDGRPLGYLIYKVIVRSIVRS